MSLSLIIFYILRSRLLSSYMAEFDLALNLGSGCMHVTLLHWFIDFDTILSRCMTCSQWKILIFCHTFSPTCHSDFFSSMPRSEPDLSTSFNLFLWVQLASWPGIHQPSIDRILHKEGLQNLKLFASSSNSLWLFPLKCSAYSLTSSSLRSIFLTSLERCSPTLQSCGYRSEIDGTVSRSHDSSGANIARTARSSAPHLSAAAT